MIERIINRALDVLAVLAVVVLVLLAVVALFFTIGIATDSLTVSFVVSSLVFVVLAVVAIASVPTGTGRYRRPADALWRLDSNTREDTSIW